MKDKYILRSIITTVLKVIFIYIPLSPIVLIEYLARKIGQLLLYPDTPVSFIKKLSLVIVWPQKLIYQIVSEYKEQSILKIFLLILIRLSHVIVWSIILFFTCMLVLKIFSSLASLLLVNFLKIAVVRIAVVIHLSVIHTIIVAISILASFIIQIFNKAHTSLEKKENKINKKLSVSQSAENIDKLEKKQEAVTKAQASILEKNIYTQQYDITDKNIIGTNGIVQDNIEAIEQFINVVHQDTTKKLDINSKNILLEVDGVNSKIEIKLSRSESEEPHNKKVAIKQQEEKQENQDEKEEEQDEKEEQKLLKSENLNIEKLKQIVHEQEGNAGSFSSLYPHKNIKKDENKNEKQIFNSMASMPLNLVPSQQLLQKMGIAVTEKEFLNKPLPKDFKPTDIYIEDINSDGEKTDEQLIIPANIITKILASPQMFYNPFVLSTDEYQFIYDKNNSIDHHTKHKGEYIENKMCAVGHCQEVVSLGDYYKCTTGTLNGYSVTSLVSSTVNDTIFVISIPALNFKYGTAKYLSKYEQYKTIFHMFYTIFAISSQKKLQVVLLPPAGLGAFGGKEQVDLYFNMLMMAALCFSNLLIVYNPGQYAGNFTQIAKTYNDPCNVLQTNKDIVHLVQLLKKEGIQVALHNPSDPDVIKGKYSPGQYWRQDQKLYKKLANGEYKWVTHINTDKNHQLALSSAYVLEEHIGRITTAPLNDFTNSKDMYNPNNVQIISITDPLVTAAMCLRIFIVYDIKLRKKNRFGFFGKDSNLLKTAGDCLLQALLQEKQSNSISDDKTSITILDQEPEVQSILKKGGFTDINNFLNAYQKLFLSIPCQPS